MRKNLALVSKHEIVRSNSHSRLEARDRETEILDLVSKHETERKKFSISSRSMRLKGRSSRSRLESWKMPLVMPWLPTPDPRFPPWKKNCSTSPCFSQDWRPSIDKDWKRKRTEVPPSSCVEQARKRWLHIQASRTNWALEKVEYSEEEQKYFIIYMSR